MQVIFPEIAAWQDSNPGIQVQSLSSGQLTSTQVRLRFSQCWPSPYKVPGCGGIGTEGRSLVGRTVGGWSVSQSTSPIMLDGRDTEGAEGVREAPQGAVFKLVGLLANCAGIPEIQGDRGAEGGSPCRGPRCSVETLGPPRTCIPGLAPSPRAFAHTEAKAPPPALNLRLRDPRLPRGRFPRLWDLSLGSQPPAWVACALLDQPLYAGSCSWLAKGGPLGAPVAWWALQTHERRAASKGSRGWLLVTSASPCIRHPSPCSPGTGAADSSSHTGTGFLHHGPFINVEVVC